MNGRLRGLAVAVALVTTGAGTVACAPVAPGRPVTVLGVWTGDEEDRFELVLGDFEARTGIDVHYQGERALSQVLVSDVSRGRPPDIVILPDAGELPRYLDRLTPLDRIVADDVWAQYPRQWQDLMRAGGNERHAVPVNATLKSLVWHRLDSPRAPPATLDELVDLGAATGANPWCLGVASSATTMGWPGTDWIEDLVLHGAGAEVYERWASGQEAWTSPAVGEAWASWERIAGGPAPQAAGNRARALLTNFTDARRPLAGPVAGTPPCFLEHQASFALAEFRDLVPAPAPGTELTYAPFPTRGGRGSRAWEVSADLAALFNDSDDARQLIAFLATPDAQRRWVEGGGFSANANALVLAAYGDDELRHRIGEHLTGADVLCFDASDVMPPSLRDAFQRAILAHLAVPARLPDLLGQLDGLSATIDPRDRLRTVCGHPAW